MADEERDRAPEESSGDPEIRDALPDDWIAEAEDRRARRENSEEPQDASAAETLSRRARRGAGADPAPESAMGGTSDAGTAGDAAAEAAALGIGLPDDRTQQLPRTEGTGTGTDKGTHGLSGGDTPPDDMPYGVTLDDPGEQRSEDPERSSL